MENLFLTVLGMSGTAAVTIAVVLLARLALRKAPKAFSYALWAVVLFRLLCPFAIQSPWSLAPSIQVEPAGESLHMVEVNAERAEVIIRVDGSPMVRPGPVGSVPADNSAPAAAPSALSMAGAVWLAGAGLLLGYSVLSMLRLRRKLVGSVPLEGEGDVRLADHIPSPFVLGLARPRIYLPSGLPMEERDYILLHERTHIRRFDHVFRLLAWLALAVHWFNPLAWLAFHLAGKDMEMSCDEAVLRNMGRDVRADYSQSLLRLSTGKRLPAGPLAFGEIDPKGRIKNVLSYKKPALWVIAAALIGVVCAVTALATNRATGSHEPDPSAHDVPGPAEFWMADNVSLSKNMTQLPEFPGVTFRWTGGSITAVTEDGETTLMQGMPIRNAYFCDLNGDGYREVCATVWYGSGLIDQHILVYDYHNSALHELWDRGVYDYSLMLEGDRLWAEERSYGYGDGTKIRSGPLVLTESGLDIRAETPADSLTFSLEESDLGPSVRMDGNVDGVALTRGAFWSPEPSALEEFPYGYLSMVYPAFTDGIEGHVTAGWTDGSRRSVTLSTKMTALLSSYIPTGYWLFTVDLDSGAVTEMTPVHWTAVEDGDAEVRLYPGSISDEEAVKAARVAAKLLTAAEDYYNSGRYDPYPAPEND